MVNTFSDSVQSSLRPSYIATEYASEGFFNTLRLQEVNVRIHLNLTKRIQRVKHLAQTATIATVAKPKTSRD